MWIHLTCLFMYSFSISAYLFSSETGCTEVSSNFVTSSIHLSFDFPETDVDNIPPLDSLDVYTTTSKFETDDVLSTSGSTGTEYFNETTTVYKTIAQNFAMIIKQYVSSDEVPTRIKPCLSNVLSKLDVSLEHGSKDSHLYIRCIVRTLIRHHEQDKTARLGKLIVEYGQLVDKLKKEVDKNQTDLNEIIRLQTEIIKVLKKIKNCVDKQEYKDKIQNEIDAREKNLNDLELVKEINDLGEKIIKEAENRAPDLNKLTDLYEKIIDALKRRKEQNDNQNTKKSITEQINIWTKIKCNVLKHRYIALLIKLLHEFNKKPQVVQKLVDLEKEIINILKKLKECCDKTDEEKNKRQEEINKREKTVKYNELLIKLLVEEAKSPKDYKKLIEIQKEMIAILKTLKNCTDDQSTKNKIQIKIDIKERKIQYYQLSDELNAEYARIPRDQEKIIKKLEDMIDVLREIKQLVNDAGKQIVQDLINKIQEEINKREKIVKYYELFRKLLVEVAQSPRNYTKLIEIEKEMIVILKTLKICTDDQSTKNKIQKIIDIIERIIQYHQLSDELKDECARIPRDTEKIIKKLEDMRDVLREIKEFLTDAGKQIVQDLINNIQEIIDNIRNG